MKGALIGEKLSHSYSADIHKNFGVDYSLIEVEPDKLKSFVDGCDLDYFNVTIPYKKQIIPYLDYIDEVALKIGAVNTVVVKNGKKYGYNTDFYGFLSLLQKNNVKVKGQNVLILGTGGTKETVNAVMLHLGAKSIKVVSRNGDVNYTNCYFENVNIIVNTTPVGMYPKLGIVKLDLTKYPNLKAVVDVIYNPLYTNFVLRGKNLSVNSFGGLYMLVAQAVKAYSLVDNSIDFSITDKIYKDLLKEKTNVVLVGMPSCGKTTIAELLAEKLNKKLVDTDKMIVEKFGDIPSIFSSYGEDYFRNCETSVIKEVSLNTNQVIATGGGAILREDNIYYLKSNSVIVYIDRDVNLLLTEGRPLSKDKQSILKLKEIREPIYNKCCDLKVENKSTIEGVVDEIIKELNRCYL